MRKSVNANTNHDIHWKEVIINYWESFIEFFLPEAHPLIDFSKKPVFLEQELHQIIKDKIKKGTKINDKLVKVFLNDGTEKWILLHIEVQSYYEKDFSERMFVYFYRIYDKYKVKMTALAIYTSDEIPKNYEHFEYNFLGTKNTYEFNTFLVRETNESELIKSNNPFALVVLSARYWNATKKNSEKRYSFKWKLMRLALRENYYRENIVSLVEFIEFLLILPSELDKKFTYSLIEYINQEDMERTRKISPLIKAFMDMSWGTNIEAEKQKAEKAEAEKIKAIEKLLLKGIMSVEEIADVMSTTPKNVLTIQKKILKK